MVEHSCTQKTLYMLRVMHKAYYASHAQKLGWALVIPGILPGWVEPYSGNPFGVGIGMLRELCTCSEAAPLAHEVILG